MLKNYLLICFRNIRRNSVFSFLNIVGLAIGIASCLLILQYVSFEASFDQFNSNRDRIFRVDAAYYKSDKKEGQTSNTPYELGPTMKRTVSGVTHFSRTHLQYYGAVVTAEGTGEDRRQFFEEDKRMYFVDQDFFALFDFELLKGNREALLTAPKSIVLTESMVKKYMPDESEPIGKFLNVDGGWYPGTYKITGVLADLPDNSHFTFGFLLPVDDLLKNDQYTQDDGWGWNNFVTYVMLDEKATFEGVSDLVRDIYNDRNEEDVETSNSRNDVVLSALNDLHLRDPADENNGGVSEQTLFLFTVVALFIIGIAWLNYINLATAQAMKRAKEIGIRKVVGAVKGQLIFQFMLEALIINLMALVLSITLAYFALPLLSEVIGSTLTLGIGIPSVYWLYFGLAFAGGTLLSGFYPALVLSNYKAVTVIKGSINSGQSKFGLRQSLVVVQLVIGVFLISGTLTVYKQLAYMSDQDLGMTVEQVISIRGPRVFDDREVLHQKIRTFKQNLLALSATSVVSISDAIPGGDYNWGTSMTKEGQDESEGHSVKMMWVDDDFHSAYDMKLLAGRFHSKDLKGEDRQVVVNETLVNKFGLGTPEEAIGQRMKVDESFFSIIGVLKDYHWYTLKDEKEPMLLNFSEFGGNISVKLSTDDIQNTIATIKDMYETQFAKNPFDFYFMDDFYNRQYVRDQQFGKIFTAFSMIAVVIACLGLFGLASFTLSLRVKEIGIRKVLGASLGSILLMIYKDYIKLILIASVIGLPIVYWAIKDWLEGYAHRIEITFDLMLWPVLLLMLITVLTVGFQSLKAAMTNPSSSLRSE